MKFKKIIKANTNSKDLTELRHAIYNAIADASFNNGNTIDFSKDDLQQAFNWCMEKWFLSEDEDIVD